MLLRRTKEAKFDIEIIGVVNSSHSEISFPNPQQIVLLPWQKTINWTFILTKMLMTTKLRWKWIWDNGPKGVAFATENSLLPHLVIFVVRTANHPLIWWLSDFIHSKACVCQWSEASLIGEVQWAADFGLVAQLSSVAALLDESAKVEYNTQIT